VTNVNERPDINVLDGSNRDRDELFQDDEIIKSIRIDRNEETKWRKIEEKP
jgi:hypothetical protein